MLPIARSKLTAQSKVSVPAAVRRRLGIGPGGVLQWAETHGAIIVRRAGRYSSEDVHRTVFGKRKPTAKTLEQITEGMRRYTLGRHARR